MDIKKKIDTAALMPEQLQKSEEKFRLLVEYSFDLLWMLNPECVFTFVSPSWKILLGYDPAHVENKAFQLFYSP